MIRKKLLEIGEDKESEWIDYLVQERLTELNESMNEEVNFDELAEEVENPKSNS